jgi:Asp-tRNA(Asn)/Glu-tRNA(Gln) amidotransferase A subunit family amidase
MDTRVMAMNWTVGLRELIADEQASARERNRATCQKIRDLMGETDYRAWINTAPDGNVAFAKAAEAKLAELTGGARGLMNNSMAQGE